MGVDAGVSRSFKAAGALAKQIHTQKESYSSEESALQILYEQDIVILAA